MLPRTALLSFAIAHAPRVLAAQINTCRLEEPPRPSSGTD